MKSRTYIKTFSTSLLFQLWYDESCTMVCDTDVVPDSIRVVGFSVVGVGYIVDRRYDYWDQ